MSISKFLKNGWKKFIVWLLLKKLTKLNLAHWIREFLKFVSGKLKKLGKDRLEKEKFINELKT